MTASFTDQDGYRVRLEWGWEGAARAATRGDAIVIVDVLRFSSAVTRAVERRAIIYPSIYSESLEATARELDAVLAARSWTDQDGTYSLSPRSYKNIAAGTRVLLPSPNGATCTLRASRGGHVFAGCLLNAAAVGHALSDLMSSSGLSATVVACGERHQAPGEDGALRFALEDYLGAGAIVSSIALEPSPEALASREAFRSLRYRLEKVLLDCASGRELRQKGREHDVIDCARLDSSAAVPVFHDGAYHPSTPAPSKV